MMQTVGSAKAFAVIAVHLLAITCFAGSDLESLDAEELLTLKLGDGSVVRVLRNTMVEDKSTEARKIDDFTYVGGKQAHITDVHSVLMSKGAPFRPWEVVWTHSETYFVRSVDDFGHWCQIRRRAEVTDIATQEDWVYILYIADQTDRLAILQRESGDDGGWKQIKTVELDISKVAGKFEKIGVATRIVEVDDQLYVHVNHATLPGDVAFRVSGERVSVVDDPTMVERVAAAESSS